MRIHRTIIMALSALALLPQLAVGQGYREATAYMQDQQVYVSSTRTSAVPSQGFALPPQNYAVAARPEDFERPVRGSVSPPFGHAGARQSLAEPPPNSAFQAQDFAGARTRSSSRPEDFARPINSFAADTQAPGTCTAEDFLGPISGSASRPPATVACGSFAPALGMPAPNCGQYAPPARVSVLMSPSDQALMPGVMRDFAGAAAPGNVAATTAGKRTAPAAGKKPIVVGAGTRFNVSLTSTLDSGYTRVHEEVQAVLFEPLCLKGIMVVPAASRLIGSVKNVSSAKFAKSGANGTIDVIFTAIETPDGKRLPLAASAGTVRMRLPVRGPMKVIKRGLVGSAVGAAGGAALGCAIGAIASGTSGGHAGQGGGMGAIFGTAIGAAAGGVVGMVTTPSAPRGSGMEVRLPAGAPLLVHLDKPLSVPTDSSTGIAQPPGEGARSDAPTRPVHRVVGYIPPQ
jgi:hypothetical protein